MNGPGLCIVFPPFFGFVVPRKGKQVNGMMRREKRYKRVVEKNTGKKEKKGRRKNKRPTLNTPSPQKIDYGKRKTTEVTRASISRSSSIPKFSRRFPRWCSLLHFHFLLVHTFLLLLDVFERLGRLRLGFFFHFGSHGCQHKNQFFPVFIRDMCLGLIQRLTVSNVDWDLHIQKDQRKCLKVHPYEKGRKKTVSVDGRFRKINNHLHAVISPK